jgi:hypothetical protein
MHFKPYYTTHNKMFIYPFCLLHYMERKRNTPQKYQAKATGSGPNPRPTCPICGKYMMKTQTKYLEDGKRKTITPNAICKCGYVEVYHDELKKIPD